MNDTKLKFNQCFECRLFAFLFIFYFFVIDYLWVPPTAPLSYSLYTVAGVGSRKKTQISLLLLLLWLTMMMMMIIMVWNERGGFNAWIPININDIFAVMEHWSVDYLMDKLSSNIYYEWSPWPRHQNDFPLLLWLIGALCQIWIFRARFFMFSLTFHSRIMSVCVCVCVCPHQ